MTNYLDLPIGDDAPSLVHAVVEIPVDSRNKYEYDKNLHVFRLDRTLFSPVHYPGDYGFIPQTLADDGDPLDVLILGESPSFPGCYVKVCPIGVLQMLDQGVGDQKILAYATGNPRFNNLSTFSDVAPHILREIEHFFSIYKDLEGKRTESKGWQGVEEARALIRECHERYHAAPKQ